MNVTFGFVDWVEKNFVIGSCITFWKVGETIGTKVGMIVEVGGGGEGGGVTIELLRVDAEIPLPI